MLGETEMGLALLQQPTLIRSIPARASLPHPQGQAMWSQDTVSNSKRCGIATLRTWLPTWELWGHTLAMADFGASIQLEKRRGDGGGKRREDDEREERREEQKSQEGDAGRKWPLRH